MQVPLEIAFRNMQPSESIKAEIESEAKRLEKFSDRITSCHVTVIGPTDHHQHGVPYKVDIYIAMPEHKDIVVSKTHGDVKQHEHVTVAIKDAFAAAQRQIEETVRLIKHHLP